MSHPLKSHAAASGAVAVASVQPAPSGPGQRVFERIQSDLMLGGYRPGEWLRLVDMEARYDASRFEIRAALARLATIEVLEHVPNRGLSRGRHRRGRGPPLRGIAVCCWKCRPSGLVARNASQSDCAHLRRLAMHFADCVESGTDGRISSGQIMPSTVASSPCAAIRGWND